MIERVAKKDVGFTCWKLFTIDYVQFYQVRLLFMEIELICLFIPFPCQDYCVHLCLLIENDRVIKAN